MFCNFCYVEIKWFDLMWTRPIVSHYKEIHGSLAVFTVIYSVRFQYNSFVPGLWVMWRRWEMLHRIIKWNIAKTYLPEPQMWCTDAANCWRRRTTEHPRTWEIPRRKQPCDVQILRQVHWTQGLCGLRNHEWSKWTHTRDSQEEFQYYLGVWWKVCIDSFYDWFEFV